MATPMARLPYRFMGLWLVILLIGSIQPAPLGAAAPAHTPLQTEAETPAPSSVYVLTFAGPVTPVLESYIRQAISDAAATGVAAIILQLDTPGGGVDVTQSIIQQILASPVPIVVYVAPAGARAGSAGTFITLAGHVAAMAPTTSIGAASPVELGGGDVDDTLASKIINILSADIENLAARRGEEATEWAIAAVQDAAAATADQALELGVIDLIATDLSDLLNQLDGVSVELPTGEHSLNVANASIIMREMTPVQRALNLLVDPNLATILLSLGVLGLIVEIRTPGFGVAGILGLVCLILAFYGLGQLDANLTGLTFMIIALALFITEAFTPTFGILTLGGIIAFLLGGALLFDTPGISTPWPTMILLALILGGLTIFIGQQAFKAQSRPVLTGNEALIGATGVTHAPMTAGERGSLFVQGEWWNAQLDSGEVSANTPVRVVAREGFTLIIVPDGKTTDAALARPSAASEQTTQPDQET